MHPRFPQSQWIRQMRAAPTREVLDDIVRAYLRTIGETMQPGESYQEVSERLQATVPKLDNGARAGNVVLSYAEARWEELEES